MQKLELKHLAPYLPYGLTVYYDKSGLGKRELGTEIIDGKMVDMFEAIKLQHIPALRPLSDLTKEIDLNGYKNIVPFNVLGNIFSIRQDENNVYNVISDIHTNSLEYNIMTKLIEWHFDVFGLIEKGLAIDINTLNA